MIKEKIAILGYGSWGKALAKIFEQNHELIIWSRVKNSRIEENFKVMENITEIESCNIILIALPTQEVRKVLQKVKKGIKKKSTIIIASKGIEFNSLSLLSEVIKEELGNDNIAVISGPNFANEIESGLPAATTLACDNENLLKYLLSSLSSENFILHPDRDIIGAQIFGAVKNIIAIACGIFLEKKLGNNAQAALITLGLNEISNLCVAKKGKSETALTLCGIGDLILTCSSSHSRNVSFGIELAKGLLPTDILAKQNTTEGVYTAKAISRLSQQLKIKMPICEFVYNIIYKQYDIDSEVKKILRII
ncbi:MAG: NAD(P)H-dependent glycerol-3-phosphate dehydrogenase [Rickettsiaceae bacterium H1]|nr:NAD(P)H-dependent glycerol-3-phosphate dehydrogenase [Rickettsiaceae bacterium H1]